MGKSEPLSFSKILKTQIVPLFKGGGGGGGAEGELGASDIPDMSRN